MNHFGCTSCFILFCFCGRCHSTMLLNISYNASQIPSASSKTKTQSHGASLRETMNLSLFRFFKFLYVIVIKPRSNFKIGGRGKRGHQILTQYWGGTKHFFLLILYNFKNIGGGGGECATPPPSGPRCVYLYNSFEVFCKPLLLPQEDGRTWQILIYGHC